LNFVYSGNTFLPHFETKDIGCIEEKKHIFSVHTDIFVSLGKIIEH